MSKISFMSAVAVVIVAGPAAAQQHDHSAMQNGANHITQPGEAAYGAIAEVVRILEVDPNTDWSRVNLEKLRLHLADMHEVTVNAVVVQKDVPGGYEADVTGEGRTSGAIQRMARAHARATADGGPTEVTVTDLPNGARVRLVARSNDAKAVQKVRALGFIGWLTQDDHHGPHHLMMASGASGAAH